MSVEDVAVLRRGLAKPDSSWACHHQGVGIVDVAPFHALEMIGCRRRERIECPDPKQADGQAENQRGRQDLPDRRAADPNNDQFAGAGELSEATQRRSQ